MSYVGCHVDFGVERMSSAWTKVNQFSMRRALDTCAAMLWRQVRVTRAQCIAVVFLCVRAVAVEGSTHAQRQDKPVVDSQSLSYLILQTGWL